MTKRGNIAQPMTHSEVKHHAKEPLWRHTPLRLGGELRNWIRISTVASLIQELSTIRQTKWRIHWPFEELLAPATKLPITMLRLEGEFERYADLGMQPESLFDEQLSAEKRVHCVRLGSSCLWSQVPWASLIPGPQIPWQKWPGSVGALLSTFCGGEPQRSPLHGCHLLVEVIVGRALQQHYFAPEDNIKLPNSSILSSITIGFRLRSSEAQIAFSQYRALASRKAPPRLGDVWLIEHANDEYDVATALRTLRLNGVRLRQWQVSASQPSLLIQQSAEPGSLDDLELLRKALNSKLGKALSCNLRLRIGVLNPIAQTKRRDPNSLEHRLERFQRNRKNKR